MILLFMLSVQCQDEKSRFDFVTGTSVGAQNAESLQHVKDDAEDSKVSLPSWDHFGF